MSKYTIHCAFPSSVLTPVFFEEQKIKPELTKQIEGSTGPVEKLYKKVPSPEAVVRQIIKGVERGDFGIADDSMDSSLLYATALGTSPKRGFGVFDTVVGIFANLIIWPLYRCYFDWLTKRDNIWRNKEKRN